MEKLVFGELRDGRMRVLRICSNYCLFITFPILSKRLCFFRRLGLVPTRHPFDLFNKCARLNQADQTNRNNTMSLSQFIPSSIIDLFQGKSSSSSSSSTTAGRVPLAFSVATAEKRTESENPKNGSANIDVIEAIVDLALSLGFTVVSGLFILYLSKRFSHFFIASGDGTSKAPSSSVVQSKLQRILKKRVNLDKKKRQHALALTHHELQMAEEILDPDTIETTFTDIGGLDGTKQEIYELAVLPLVQPELFANSKLVQPCRGMLLYGRPGTGKTMLAKALAKEAQAVFLPLQLSKMLNKWVGESNKMVAATFSLAHKLEPAIIFIDELDTFLKASNSETAYLDAIRAEFLTLWDGVSTSQNSRVLVLGATNKPHLIDPAILRRMPRTFEVKLPDAEGRQAILELLLLNGNERVEEDVEFYLPELAGSPTAGYSGSDLKELCKAAAMVPVQEVTAEFARQRVMEGATTNEKGEEGEDQKKLKAIRPISIRDLEIGLEKVKRTGVAAMKYGRDEAAENERERAYNNSNSDINEESLRNFLRAMSIAAQQPPSNGR